MTSCLSIGHPRNGLSVFAHEFDGLRRPLDSGRLTTDDGKQNAFFFTLRYIDAFEPTSLREYFDVEGKPPFERLTKTAPSAR